MCEAQWGIACHSTNGSNSRAMRWYYVARLIEVDGCWFELYWHPHLTGLRGNSRERVRQAARASGLELLEGYFENAPSPRVGSGMIRRMP
jgi:hypothetical protein